MHTGMVVMTGKAPVHISWKKQQCMSKSQMDSELIGLTDNLGLVELFNEFVSFIAGTAVEIPIVYQDSTSVI